MSDKVSKDCLFEIKHIEYEYSEIHNPSISVKDQPVSFLLEQFQAPKWHCKVSVN